MSEGRRSEFAAHGWSSEAVPDPQAESTREDSVLAWSEVGVGEHRRMLRWYCDLIGLRREHADLGSGDLAAVEVLRPDTAAAGTGWLVMHRTGFSVVANLDEEPVTVDVGREVAEVIAHFGELRTSRSGPHTVRLGAHSVAVVRAAR